MATYIDLSSSRERDNYIRLARLLISGGTPILRALLHTYHPYEDLATNLRTWKTHLERYAKLTQPQRESLYSASGDPDSANFDLSLLYKLLRNICGLVEPACKWDGVPMEGDESLEADIVRLRNYRNEIFAHVLDGMAIPSAIFTKYWKDISNALIRINATLNGNASDIEVQINRLRYSSIANDETDKILKEIRQTLQDQTKALGRIENQGDQIYKEIEGLKDKVIQQSQNLKTDNRSIKNTTSFSANSNINSSSSSNNNNNINITNNVYIGGDVISSDTNTLQQLLNPSSNNQSAIKAPPGLQPLEAGSSRPLQKRTMSCPANSNLPRYPETNRYERSLSTDNQTNGSNDYHWASRGNKPFSSSLKTSTFQRLYSDEEESHNDPFSFSLLKEECRLPAPEDEKSQGRLPSGRSKSTPLKASADPFEPKAAKAAQFHSTNKTYEAEEWRFPEDFPKHQESEEISTPNRSNLRATSTPFIPNMVFASQSESKVATVSSSSQRHGPDWHFPSDDSSSPLPCCSNDLRFVQGGSRTSDGGRQVLRHSSPLSSPNVQPFNETCQTSGEDHARRKSDPSFQWLQSNDGRILHIRIRVHDNSSPERKHLGKRISQSLRGYQSASTNNENQFRSYLIQAMELTIEEVESENDMCCCIGVSACELESLETLWRNYITGDLRVIFKETVLPEDFDGQVEVIIDGKEYEACCKRLAPKDLGDYRMTHSQSFCCHDESSEEDSLIDIKSQSLEELSSSSKRAFDELFLLLCKYGGKMKYTEVITMLSSNGRAEIEKAMQQGKMEERFRILSGNVIQARLIFCPNSQRDCSTNCPDLHICPYYLLEACTFHGKCQKSHDISDNHTNGIFRKANLSTLSPEERHKLLKSMAYTVPDICKFYNSKGSQNKCGKNDKCPYLHVCEHWVKGDCWFSQNKKTCSRAHTFDHHATQKILKERNLLGLSENEIKEKLLEQNR